MGLWGCLLDKLPMQLPTDSQRGANQGPPAPPFPSYVQSPPPPVLAGTGQAKGGKQIERDLIESCIKSRKLLGRGAAYTGLQCDTRVPVTQGTPRPCSKAQSYLAKPAKHIRCPFIVDKESKREQENANEV